VDTAATAEAPAAAAAKDAEEDGEDDGAEEVAAAGAGMVVAKGSATFKEVADFESDVFDSCTIKISPSSLAGGMTAEAASKAAKACISAFRERFLEWKAAIPSL
jgi:hypothetical protein